MASCFQTNSKKTSRIPSAYQAAKLRDLLDWFTQKLRVLSYVGQGESAFFEMFEGTIVQDKQVRAVHTASMVSTVSFDLDPFVRGCLWIIESLLLNLENVAPIAQVPAPPAGNWCDVYFFRGDDADEMLEACQFHVAFHFDEDLSVLANREELWLVVQLLWGPNHENMHAACPLISSRCLP